MSTVELYNVEEQDDSPGNLMFSIPKRSTRIYISNDVQPNTTFI